jgi:hypothetical protein
MTKPAVRAALDAALAERKSRLEVEGSITEARILRELAAIAFGDLRRVMAWGPGGIMLRESAELTDREAAQVAEVAERKGKQGASKSLKRHDKVRSLELLGRHLGMFGEAKDRIPAPPPVGQVTAEAWAKLSPPEQDAYIRAVAVLEGRDPEDAQGKA